MTTAKAKRTVLHSVNTSNYEGGTEHAFSIIREEGRKAGEVRVAGIINQGVALMKVARFLYSEDEKTMKKNQDNARMEYVLGWNAGVGLDEGAKLSTNVKDKTFIAQSAKFGTWIKAGYHFRDDPEKCKPFIDRLAAAIASKPLPTELYQSLAERMLTALRKVVDDATIIDNDDKELVALVAPKDVKAKVKAKKEAKAKREAAKVATVAAETAKAAPKGTDFTIMFNGAKHFAEMADKWEKEHPTLKARLLKVANELADLAEALQKEEDASAAKASATVEAIKAEARKPAAKKGAAKAKRTK